MAETKFTNLRTVGTLAVGSVLTVVGAITGASFSAPTGSNTTVTAPASQAIVYTFDGTERSRLVPPQTMTATGANKRGAGVNGQATADTIYLASPLSTTGAITAWSIECGNVAKALQGDFGFVKAANTGTGTALTNGSNVIIGTGAYIYHLTGATLWNPADKLKFGTTTVPTGTLDTTRYDCSLFVNVTDIKGR